MSKIVAYTSGATAVVVLVVHTYLTRDLETAVLAVYAFGMGALVSAALFNEMLREQILSKQKDFSAMRKIHSDYVDSMSKRWSALVFGMLPRLMRKKAPRRRFKAVRSTTHCYELNDGATHYVVAKNADAAIGFLQEAWVGLDCSLESLGLESMDEVHVKRIGREEAEALIDHASENKCPLIDFTKVGYMGGSEW